MNLALAIPRHRRSAWANSLCIHALRDELNPRPPILPSFDHANLCAARTLLANKSLEMGFGVTLFIDDDIEFDPEEAVRMVEECCHDRPIVGAAFATKERFGRVVTSYPDSGKVTFFKGGGLYKVDWLGFGLVAIHRSVFESMRDAWPSFSIGLNKHQTPYFTAGWGQDGHWRSEDIRFCLDAKALGHDTWLDSRPRLFHSGEYQYGLEDTVAAVERVESFTLEVNR